MRLLTYILAILLFLPVKARGEAIDTPVEPLLLYKAKQDVRCQQWVDSIMNKLTLKEKVGQLFIYTIAPVDTKRNQILLKDAVDTYKVGGLLFSGGKMQTQAELTNRAQRMAKLPLMITFDGEWGLAMRLRGTPVFPRNMVLGCIQDNKLIYEYGREMARQCVQLGVQVNFAPVADVNINPKNPVINTRSFGEDPVRVADKVVAYASGLEGGGVLSVCKHFPGHGDTDVDSHKTLPVLPFTRERLDSVELHPFKEAIRAGLSGMMVGHLQVPVIEPIGGLPSSLSRNIVYDLLTEEFAFKGLIFTDALAMKGVSGNGNVSLQALKAGNDMVLAPRNLKEEIAAVLDAIDKGELTREDIEEKCRKVLTYKYVLGLKKKPFVQLSGLGQRNTPQTRDLIRRLNLAAITVLNNENHVLPLHTNQKETMALLEVGDAGETNALAEQLSKYTSLSRFRLRPGMTEEANQRLRDSLAAYKRIIVAVSEQKLSPYQTFFGKFTTEAPVIYAFFTQGKMMLQIQRAVARASAVVLGHSPNEDVQRQVADVLFAKATADGRLSASLGELFQAGDGVTITPKTPLHFIPEEHGLSSVALQRIDSIALDGVRQGAYPGCQVLVLKDGQTVYDKCFGIHSDKDTTAVRPTDLFDLASLTKTTATLLAVMKLYDGGKLKLTDKVSQYLPFLRSTNKKNITIKDLLLHESGLPPYIRFYLEVIDPNSVHGPYAQSWVDEWHRTRVSEHSYYCSDFKFKKGLVSEKESSVYNLHVADKMWLNKSFKNTILQKIARCEMDSKRYVYSDLGFILLQQVVESIVKLPMDLYLAKEFYAPMGLQRTMYLPLQKYSKEEIMPTAANDFLRRQDLCGYVHDEAAACMGGISGNAGLFSTASEVAKIYQMILNGGEWNGKRYLSEATCRLFTTETSAISRRGLGFDKPNLKDLKNSPCAASATAAVYGHTGFTGTCAWVDPEHGTVYVFLSNRLCPNVWNTKLGEMNIRTDIQEAIYKSLK